MYEILESEDGLTLQITPPVEGVTCVWNQFSGDMGEWIFTTPGNVQFTDTTDYALNMVREYLGLQPIPLPGWSFRGERENG